MKDGDIIVMLCSAQILLDKLEQSVDNALIKKKLLEYHFKEGLR